MAMQLQDLLRMAVERKASDLHLKVGSPPVLRIDENLYPLVDQARLAAEDTVAMAFSIMNNKQKEKFREHNELDLAYSVAGLGRFRANVFQQRSTVAIALRVIPIKILTIQELNLPPVLEKLAMEPRGLLLVTGTTGSGKSSTLAGMTDYINSNRTGHIITIEDPVEFLHRDRKCLINQREVGIDTEGFSMALRSALRQDPDVILVGEMRDYDTISTALIAAETGHLVMSTLHTIDAAETIHRIITVFPPYQHKQVRLQLASVIKGIISQRLIPRVDGKGRVPAVEVMIATQTIREAIVDPDKTRKIPEVIAAGVSQYKMQTFDQSLMQLYRTGKITYEDALIRSSNPDDFALRVRGIESLADPTWQGQEAPKPKGMERFSG